MNWFHEISKDHCFKDEIFEFLDLYGTDGLKEALIAYEKSQQMYIYKTKSIVTRLRIDDIYYLEIWEHNIAIHMEEDVHHKYGSLTQELQRLAPFHFVRCSNNTIVSISKIDRIEQKEIILKNGIRLHMSRSCSTKVVAEFMDFA